MLHVNRMLYSISSDDGIPLWRIPKRLASNQILILILVLLQLQSVWGFSDTISTGFNASSMSYVDTDGNFLQSVGNVFTLSFFSHIDTNLFYLCIIHRESQVVVWTANRDSPLAVSDRLVFSHDGNAALVHGSTESVVWSTNTSGLGVKRMQILDSGNLVLLDEKNNTAWQSFDHPTNTLLCGQILRLGTSLRSSVSNGNMSSGLYSMSLVSQDLQLKVSSDPDLSEAYWSMMTDTRLISSGKVNVSYAVLNSSGLSLDSLDGDTLYSISWTSKAVVCRALLEYDGNLIVYVYSSNVWTVQFTALQSECLLPLQCGPSGICSSGQCSCPDSLQPLNDNNITQGCDAPVVPQCKTVSNLTFHFLEEIGDGLDYFANRYMSAIKVSSMDACKQLCIKNCSCSSMFYYNESGSCFLYPRLLTIQRTGTSGHYLYVKTNESTTSDTHSHSAQGLPVFLIPVIIASIILFFVVLSSSIMYIFFKLKSKEDLLEEEGFADDDKFLESIPGMPTRFTFKELQFATNNFSTKLGEGGFGSVYEGELRDGTRIAVKQLEGIGQGKKEFRAEVEIIARINHVHLVQLYGFCADGYHRLLVYEFMSKGSLDKLLFAEDEQCEVLDWRTRFQIALGTARGLAYLHNDCREKIIHCDIKPENILLDQNYTAKVSDFGLSKLLNKEQSLFFTNVRGTRGYLAPEWIMNLGISEKTDVYSFGMVLLELISGRKNCGPENTYFPAYAVQQVEKGELDTLIDKKLIGIVEPDKDFIDLLRIAFWCIQEAPSSRPSMVEVVQMLEGNMEVSEPPLSSLYATKMHANVFGEKNTEQYSRSLNQRQQSSLLAIQLSAAR